MKYFLGLICLCLLSLDAAAQGFEVTGLQDFYKATIGDVVKAPLHIRNTSDKPITLVIRKTGGQIGTSQRNYFCRDGNCLDQEVEDIIVKLESGETLSSLQVALEAGLVPGISSVRYLAYNRANPGDALEFDLDFIVEEKPERSPIYASRSVALQDVYPNPASDFAFVDYKVLQDNVEAKILIHSILGNTMGEYELSMFENQAKISTGELNAGIYFYTLYVDGEAVMTRKLVVKR